MIVPLFCTSSVSSLIVASAIFSNSLSFLLTQFDTVNDIPDSYFKNREQVFGRVVRVIDGDTLRVLHCPTKFFCPKLDKNERRIYDKTLSIRLYGIDAPELQKRKSDAPSQPFAEESKDLISSLVLDKKVSVKLLRRDQYGRAVANVRTSRTLKSFPPLIKKDLSVELTKRGLATLYTGGGAEYDGNRQNLESLQRRAEKYKRGVFSLKDGYTPPSEFKKQQRQQKQPQTQKQKTQFATAQR